jgi:hypothetical protein
MNGGGGWWYRYIQQYTQSNSLALAPLSSAAAAAAAEAEEEGAAAAEGAAEAAEEEAAAKKGSALRGERAGGRAGSETEAEMVRAACELLSACAAASRSEVSRSKEKGAAFECSETGDASDRNEGSGIFCGAGALQKSAHCCDVLPPSIAPFP